MKYEHYTQKISLKHFPIKEIIIHHKSLQTLIKLLHRRFRGSTAEKTLVRLFHFLMLSIRPNVLVSKLLLLTFYLEIYFRPLFSQENLKLKHYSDDDALVLL